MKSIKDKVTLAMRCYNLKGKQICACDVLDDEEWAKIVWLDEGYYIFWDIQNSTAYLAMRKRDAFAMIRQLGFPPIFITQSVAETKWKDLLKCLGKTFHNKEYTSEEIDAMDYKTKCELIHGDSLTLAGFFENCFTVFMKDVVKCKCKPIGEVTDYFWRKEFASRGAVHVHWFAYINDAPVYGESSNEYVADYYDNIVLLWCTRRTHRVF